MTRKVQDIYTELGKKLGDLEARMILQERAGLSWASLISDPDQCISDSKWTKIQEDLGQRLQGKPLSKIFGKKEFWGMVFETSEHTLDPRPDSETLIEVALKYYKDKKPPETILDLGTGTGCLLLTLLSEFPSAKGVAVDISQEALDVAQRNAKKHNLDSRVVFTKGKWTQGIKERFDLIVSNPPYIASKVIPNLEKEVKNHDPILALDGGKDGLQAYNEIFSDILRVMKDDAMALFEIGFDQEDEIMRLGKKYKIRIGDVHRDLAENPRVVDMFKK